MAGTLFGLPFDEELFSRNWRQAPDPVTTAFLDSGAMVLDQEIADQIAGGSNVYTVPFFNTLGGIPVNYDGKTDITTDEIDGGDLSGVVYGRAKGWKARDFIADFHKVDPMGAIVSQVAGYWDKQHQAMLIRIAKAVFGVSEQAYMTDAQKAYTAAFASHLTDISSGSTTVSAGNKLAETSINDALVKACGDKAQGQFKLAIMHSTVAKNLANLDLLEFRKYTDPMGIQRTLNIADANGMTVVVSDQVPTVPGSGSSATKYTSYIFGEGAFRYAPAPVNKPVGTERSETKNGGEDTLVTRLRETILPNGFSYTHNGATDGVSPDDATLGNSAKYAPVVDPKCIGMAQIVSNG